MVRSSPALHQLDVLTLYDVEAADARGDVNTHFMQIRLFRFPVRHLHRKIRAGQGQLDGFTRGVSASEIRSGRRGRGGRASGG
jgi:hypothetical protein